MEMKWANVSSLPDTPKVLSRKASSHLSRKLIQCLESGSWLLWADGLLHRQDWGESVGSDAPLHRQDWGESVGSDVSSGPLTHHRAPSPSVLLSLCPQSSSWSSQGPSGRMVPAWAAVCSQSLLCRPTRFCVPQRPAPAFALLYIFKNSLCFNHVPLPRFYSFHECIPFYSFNFNFSNSQR